MKKVFQLLIGLALIGRVISLLYSGIKFIWVTLSTINPSLAVGIIAAGSTVIVSVVSVLISKHLEQKTAIKNQQREKKIPIYEELLTFIFTLWRPIKDGTEPPAEKEILDFMFNFTPKLIVWGSSEVVIKFAKFKSSTQDPNTLIFSIEDIWLAIRKDLGHNDKNLSRGTLLGLIINDIDQLTGKI